MNFFPYILTNYHQFSVPLISFLLIIEIFNLIAEKFRILVCQFINFLDQRGYRKENHIENFFAVYF